tara:strand:- start:288 stop:1394 length:1107 start_codon:yes stop_codon:yes gene_type:complete
MIIHVIQDIGAFNLFFKEICEHNKKTFNSNYYVLTKKHNLRIDFNSEDVNFSNILFIEDFSFFQIYKLFFKANVIHVEMSSTLFRPSFFFLSNFFRKKLILTIHGWIFQKQNFISKISTLLLVGIEKIFTLNKSDYKIFKSSSLSVENLNTIGFGVSSKRLISNDLKNKTFWDPNFSSSRPITFTFLGRISELKGFHILPDLIKGLLANGYKINSFYILGKIDKKRKSSKINLALESLKNYSFVKFIGFTKETTLYMKKSDFIVLPSLREGISIAMCEALVLNKPLITYGCRGAFDLLGKKYTANCNDFGKPESLICIIDKFINDISFRNDYFNYIKTLYPKILRENNSKIISKQYCESYKLIINKHD